jgi:hypothetical protein
MVPGLGGFAYSVDPAPADPGLLAVGVGDDTIRLWNVSAAAVGGGAAGWECGTLWKGLQAKVMALARTVAIPPLLAIAVLYCPTPVPSRAQRQSRKSRVRSRHRTPVLCAPCLLVRNS